MKAVARKITEDDYMDYLAKEDNQSFALQLVDRVLEQTETMISENYIRSQILPSALQFVKDTCERQIDWYFLKRDNGEINENSWIPDTEPEPCPMDSWTTSVVPHVTKAAVATHPGLVLSKRSLLVTQADGLGKDLLTNSIANSKRLVSSRTTSLSDSQASLGSATKDQILTAKAGIPAQKKTLISSPALNASSNTSLPEIEEEARLYSALPPSIVSKNGLGGAFASSPNGTREDLLRRKATKAFQGRFINGSNKAPEISNDSLGSGRNVSKMRLSSNMSELSASSLGSRSFQGTAKRSTHSGSVHEGVSDKLMNRHREKELSIFEENKKLLNRIPLDGQKERKSALGINFDHMGRIILTRLPGQAKLQNLNITSKLLPITLSTGKASLEETLQQSTSEEDISNEEPLFPLNNQQALNSPSFSDKSRSSLNIKITSSSQERL